MKETLTKTNPDYDIVMKRLHLYYDMKLVTFGIDKKKFDNSFSSIHSTIHTATIDFISTRNSTSTSCRQEH